MKAQHLRNALPAVCEATTGQKGIRIVWQGPPKTDGKTIYSHPLPAQADEETMKLVIGDIDHECVHILYSDFALLARENPEPLVKGVWNALEDTMGERRLGEQFIGCKETLRESAEIVVKRGKARTGRNGPSDALITFCDAWGRYHVNQQDMTPILASSREALTGHLGEKGVGRLEALLATKLYSVASTAETLALAGQVLQLVKDIEEEQQAGDSGDEGESGSQEGDQSNDQSESGSDGADGESGQQDDSNANGQGGPESGDGGNGTEDEDAGDQDGDDGQGADGPDGDDSARDPGDSPETSEDDAADAQGDSAPADGAGDTSNGAAAILDDDDVDTRAVVDLKAQVEAAVEEREASGAFVPGNASYRKPQLIENRARYDGLKRQIGGEIAQLQRRLASLFETRKRCRSVVSEAGRLDGRRLHLALAGSRAVYRRKEVKVVPKPAVSFALDCSDSMLWGSDKMSLALQAVVALVEVCDRMAVPTEIVVFGNEVGTVKTFDQPLARTRDGLGGIVADGGTPAAEGLWEAGARLVQRREDRKILFAVTDGVPDDPAATKEVGGMIEASGIELYGIGIGSSAIRHYCSKSEVLSSADGIAAAVLNALETRML